MIRGQEIPFYFHHQLSFRRTSELKVDCVCVCVHSAAVKTVSQSLHTGDSTVGMAVEMGTHVPEDDVWQLWLGVNFHVCDSPLIVSLGQVSGNPLGPFRCVFQSR